MENFTRAVAVYERPSRTFSKHSTEGVPDSLWFCSDFILGAGTVIIQPTTGRVVLIYRDDRKVWFLPKGRKDVGESLEQTALREAYEESGYRAHFLPLNVPTRAPTAPVPSHPNAHGEGSLEHADQLPVNREPIYISTRSFGPNKVPGPNSDKGGQYITFWYVAFIGPDAIREENTGTADEMRFVGHLVSAEEAVKKIEETATWPEDHVMAQVVKMAHTLWLETEQGRRATYDSWN